MVPRASVHIDTHGFWNSMGLEKSNSDTSGEEWGARATARCQRAHVFWEHIAALAACLLCARGRGSPWLQLVAPELAATATGNALRALVRWKHCRLSFWLYPCLLYWIVNWGVRIPWWIINYTISRMLCALCGNLGEGTPYLLVYNDAGKFQIWEWQVWKQLIQYLWHYTLVCVNFTLHDMSNNVLTAC